MMETSNTRKTQVDMSMCASLVSYFWGIRDYNFANGNSNKQSKESLYSYINNESYTRVAAANHSAVSNCSSSGGVNRSGGKCVEATTRMTHLHSPAYYRRGSPAFRRKGRLKRQGSVSPLNFSSAPHRLSSKSSGLSTPGQPPPPSSVHASARSRGIPVRSGSAANSSVSAASSTVVSRAGSTGDTSPRSCSSKESTPSPFHSPRNSLYVSSSSSCAVSPTGGIFTANGGGGTPRISSVYDEDEAELNEEAYFESKCSSGEASRPALLSSSSIEEDQEEAYSSLISSSSVEVLSPVNSNYDSLEDRVNNKDYNNTYNKNTSYKSKNSRIPPPQNSRQKRAQSAVAAAGSRIVRNQFNYLNNNNNTSDNVHKPVTNTTTNSPRITRKNPPNSAEIAPNTRTAAEPSTPASKDDTKEETEMMQPETVDPHDNQRLATIDANSRSTNNKRKYLKTEAEKVLKDQLSRGKIPPKAKFRADDEISIGEPAPTSSGATKLSAGVISAQQEAVASARPRAPPTTEATGLVADTENEENSPVVEPEALQGKVQHSDSLDVSPLSSLPPRLNRGHSVKSASLDHHYRTVAQSVESSPRLQHPHKLFKSSSTNFFQRLSSLRLSLTERRSASQAKITPHLTNSNSGFFQGISGNCKLLPAPYTIKHSVNLVIPPLLPVTRLTGAVPARRRKRPRRIPPPGAVRSAKTRRSFSFTDAQFIAQAAYEGDADLIHELYPGFPYSEPIYNLTKPKKSTAGGANNNNGDKMVKPTFLDRSPVKYERRTSESSVTTSGNKNLTVITVGRSGSISGPSVPTESPVKSAGSPAAKGSRFQADPRTPATPNVNFYSPQEPSPIISPWSRSSSSSLPKTSTSSLPGSSSSGIDQPDNRLQPVNTTNVYLDNQAYENKDVIVHTSPITRNSDNVVLVECNGNVDSEGNYHQPGGKVGLEARHPFIQRVHNQGNHTSGLSSASSNSTWNSQSTVSLSPSKFGANSQLSISSEISTSSFNQHTPVASSTLNSTAVANHNLLNAKNNGNSNVNSPNDPFRQIISLADSNISQAESILSSLGCERSTGLQATTGCSDSEEDEPSLASTCLSSDIESNIRKLERTQAKINAALETFRSVQNGVASAATINSNFQTAVNTRLTSNTLDNADFYKSIPRSISSSQPNSLGASLNHSGNRRDSRHRVTYPQSKAELNNHNFRKLSHQPISNPALTTATPATTNNGRKTSLFRRHSFNHNYKAGKDTKVETAATCEVLPGDRDNSLWGESDVESARSSAVYDDYAYSDSEGGSFSPLKNKIRVLLGSFGKGKRKLGKSPKRKTEPIVSMRDPMDKPELSESLSIGQFTELVKGLPANHIAHKAHNAGDQSPSFLRPKTPKSHRLIAAKDSNDTCSSVSTNQSFNVNNSNRNSIISAQSISSESFENDNNSASDENGGASSSNSPHAAGSAAGGAGGPNGTNDLTPEQKEARKLFFIAQEIMTSEKVYVDVLRLLNTEFREYVQKARQESKSGIMPDQDFVKLFSNLPELQMLNEDLLRDFEARIENWSNTKKISDVIVRKGPYLKLYTVYIRDFSAMNFHFEECCSRYHKFGKLVKEFEKLPRCQHLKLQHYMLKPVQRLPQYRLLLEDYLKHLDPESEDFDDTTQALNIVSEAAEHANNTVKQGDKFQRMLKLQSRVGDWELIKPGRELVKEGELHKISRKGIGSRYFILLSDCLLYTSYQGSWAGDNTHLKVGYVIMLNQLTVSLPPCQDSDYSTEFYITSNIRSCTLRAKDVKERNDWLDALNTAIEDYRSRKATFMSGENAQLTNPDAQLGESAPVWIPDQRVTMCQVCGVVFNMVQRRHHCRACGKVVCTSCSKNKAPLRYKSWESHRVCDSCFDYLEKQHGEDMDLRPRFKRRDHSRSNASAAANNKYMPHRLKISANSEGSQMAGHLRSRKAAGNGGRSNAKWKRSWFVLKDRVLYHYKASEDTVAIETLPVLGWNLQLPQPQDFKNLDLAEPGELHLVFQLVHSNSETYQFHAESHEIAQRWIAELKSATLLS